MQELINELFTLNEYQLKEVEKFINELKNPKKKRSLNANAYFHTLINQLAKYNRSNDYAISDEEMKINMNLSYGTIAKNDDGEIIGVMIPKGNDIKSFYPYAKWYKEKDGCDCYLFYKRTSQLNSTEFYQLIKGVEKECKDVGIKVLSDIEFEEMMKNY